MPQHRAFRGLAHPLAAPLGSAREGNSPVQHHAGRGCCWTTRWVRTKRACRVTEAEDALVVTFDVVVCDSLLTCVNVEDERSLDPRNAAAEPGSAGAAMPGRWRQHHHQLATA